MNKIRTRISAALALLGIATAGNSQAAFQDPSVAPWGGWTRGDPGTLYAGWNVFSDEADPGIVDRTPDVLASFLIGGGTAAGPAVAAIGPGPFTTTEAGTFGTFVTGGGNIYNFALATAFTVEIGASAAATPMRLALQVRTQGTELAYGNVRVNGELADSRDELGRSSLGGFGGALVDSLFVWTLDGGADRYAFTFEAAGSSLSLDALTVDIAPVPLPMSVWLLGSAVAGLAAVRRRPDAVALS